MAASAGAVTSGVTVGSWAPPKAGSSVKTLKNGVEELKTDPCALICVVPAGTALLISTKRALPASAAASAAFQVPSVLLRSAAQALSCSISGTCLNAAAWKTMSGRQRVQVARRCARSLTSPTRRTSARPGKAWPISCSSATSASAGS